MRKSSIIDDDDSTASGETDQGTNQTPITLPPNMELKKANSIEINSLG
jgi:hypothetical protein